MTPVVKARDVADLRPIVAGGVDRALAHVEAMTSELPSPYRPGVRRFVSIEEAQADRDAAVVARMRSLRQQRSLR